MRFIAFFCVISSLIFCNNASGFQKPSIPSAIVYEDDKVVLYYPYVDLQNFALSGFPHPFIMLHKKASQNTELYNIKRLEEKGSNGLPFLHEVIDVEAEFIWIKKMIIGQLELLAPTYPKINRFSVHHYIESEELVEPPSEYPIHSKSLVIQKQLEKVLGKKHKVRGLPVTAHLYWLKNNRSDMTLASSWRASMEAHCHNVRNCGKAIDNTFTKAEARLYGRAYEKTVTSRRAIATQVAAEHGWNSDYDITMHGYKNIHPLISLNNVEYYIIIDAGKNDNRTHLIAIHDIKRDDYIVDMDIIVGRTNGGNPQLSYRVTGSYYAQIAKEIGPIIKRINPKSLRFTINHHVKNAVYPQILRDHIPGLEKGVDPAVFVASYSLEPPVHNKAVASSPVHYFFQIFGHYRHSYDAKLKYLQDRFNNKKNGGRGLSHEYYYAEEKEVIRLATPKMIERRKKYAYLTDGYWAFHEMPMGQYIIDGVFQNVKVGIDFRTMYSAFVQAFHTNCQAYIKDPVPYVRTTTNRTIDNGNVHDEVQDTQLILVEKSFSKKFKEYFEDGKKDLLGDVADIVINTKRRGGLSSPRMSRKLNIIDTVNFFFNEEQCDSVTMNRFADNLLRKAYENDPIKR